MDRIIDFHSHTFFSDGLLSPAELVRNASCNGYKAIGITDHADSSNIEFLLTSIIKFAKETQPYFNDITIIPGIEITHVPPGQVKYLTDKARALGAKIVILHGETITEPVAPGTNRAGILAGVDIIAHPGLITEEDVQLAAAKGIYLEISGRKSHGLANGRVLKLAKQYNAQLVLDSDTHAPGDLLTEAWRQKVAFGAGMNDEDFNTVVSNMNTLFYKLTANTKTV